MAQKFRMFPLAISSTAFFSTLRAVLQLHEFLAFFPEIDHGFVKGGDVGNHVAQQVERGVQLHLQAGEHAHAQDDVHVFPALLNGLRAQL